MPKFSGGVRRFFAGAGCLTIPALLALGPSQAAFADTAPGTPTPVTTTVNTVTSTVSSGLGLSSTSGTTSKTATPTAAKPSSTSGATSTTSSGLNPPATGCAAAITAGGLCVYTEGATVTADPSNGAWVSLCNLQINGSGLDYSYAGVNGGGPGADISGNSGGSSPASNGCSADGTTATGNIAAALGPTAASLDGTNGLVADTCGLAVALDLSNLSTASVLCGSAPGLGRTDVNQANLLAMLGPAYAQLSPSLDLNADICGAAAAAGLTDTTTKASVFCETLSSAQNWQAGVPGTTVSIGDNFLSADLQKTFVSAELANNPGVFLTICDANVGLGGSTLLDTGRVDVPISLGGTAPDVNCHQDANQNPIVSNGMINLTVGDTGAGGGATDLGGTGGTCGGGGGATQGGSGSTTNSCGTAPGSGPCTSLCNGANASGNIAAVVGQNNAGAGANSGPGGQPGLQGNACGGSGSGDPNNGSAAIDCGPPGAVTSVQGITSPPKQQNPPPPSPANANAAAVTRLANTGLPVLSGLLGLVLLAVGAVEFLRRREEDGLKA